MSTVLLTVNAIGFLAGAVKLQRLRMFVLWLPASAEVGAFVFRKMGCFPCGKRHEVEEQVME